ncbi:hypothetical protein BOTBODRAFT_641308 [Botryobasidium botryosum FD-172 SS1]|uniref:Uncharacterized protein n=1 Tax=Botryobasidium botryosum (strain FD-172 SS1) TaxID=930990 RepID=A0A067ME47_BOTB1|nr:hypothetical protein BOTBODRAFT_641308 [Botryobasidium botryosum FD-172 SS1]
MCGVDCDRDAGLMESVDEDRLIWKSSEADSFAKLRESIIKNTPPAPPHSVTTPIGFLPTSPRSHIVDSVYPESFAPSSSGGASTLSLAARCHTRRKATLSNRQAAAGASALFGDLSVFMRKIVESGQQAMETAKTTDVAVAGPSVPSMAPPKEAQHQGKRPEARPRRASQYSKPTSAGKQSERAPGPAEGRAILRGDCLNHKSKSLGTLPYPLNPFRKSSQGTSDSPICIDDDSNSDEDDGNARDVNPWSPRKRTPIVSPAPPRRPFRTPISVASQKGQQPPSPLPLHQHSQQRRLGMRGPAISAHAATLGMKAHYSIQVPHQAVASSVKSRVPPKQTMLTKLCRVPRPAAPAPPPPPLRTPPRTHAMSVASPAEKPFSSDPDIDMDALEEVMRKYDN